jgi:hypothetical protein
VPPLLRGGAERDTALCGLGSALACFSLDQYATCRVRATIWDKRFS